MKYEEEQFKKKMNTILIDFTIYVFFVALLYSITLVNRNCNAHNMSSNLVSMFIKAEYTKSIPFSDIINWRG